LAGAPADALVRRRRSLGWRPVCAGADGVLAGALACALLRRLARVLVEFWPAPCLGALLRRWWSLVVDTEP